MQHREPGDGKNLSQISPLMELCIHGGGVKFKRDVKVLDPNSDMARKLKMILSECVDLENSISSKNSDPLRGRKNEDDSEDTESYKSAESDSAESLTDVMLEGESRAAAAPAAVGRKRSASVAVLSKDESGDVMSVKVPRCGLATEVLRVDGDSDRCTLKTATGMIVLVVC